MKYRIIGIVLLAALGLTIVVGLDFGTVIHESEQIYESIRRNSMMKKVFHWLRLMIIWQMEGEFSCRLGTMMKTCITS